MKYGPWARLRLCQEMMASRSRKDEATINELLLRIDELEREVRVYRSRLEQAWESMDAQRRISDLA